MIVHLQGKGLVYASHLGKKSHLADAFILIQEYNVNPRRIKLNARQQGEIM